MSQLRLVFVNSKAISWSTKPSSAKATASPKTLPPLPAVAVKAARLHALRPRAAAIIEELIDDVLSQIA